MQSAVQLPPQSVSLSVPFLTPSEQLAARHTLAVHTPLAQSELIAQPRPVLQAPQVPPPQSTSVSLPL
jgi:hypothetical protein